MINKKSKILIAIIIFLLAIIVTSTVNARCIHGTDHDVSYQVQWKKKWDNVGRISVESATWFCGEKNGVLNNKTYCFDEKTAFDITKKDYRQFQYIAYIYSYFYDNIQKDNILGDQQRLINEISDTEYVALQQILWNSNGNGRGNLLNSGTSKTITNSTAQLWKDEADIYQDYINQTQVEPVQNNTEFDRIVNSEAGTITLGAFSVNYLYAGKEKSSISNSNEHVLFSGIEDIIVYDTSKVNESLKEIDKAAYDAQVENARISGIKLIDVDGKIVGSNSTYKYPRENTEFYIEVPYTGEASNLGVKVKFKYVDTINARFRMYELNSTKIYHSAGSRVDEDGDRYDLSTSISQDLLKYYNTEIVWKKTELDLTRTYT